MRWGRGRGWRSEAARLRGGGRGAAGRGLKGRARGRRAAAASWRRRLWTRCGGSYENSRPPPGVSGFAQRLRPPCVHRRAAPGRGRDLGHVVKQSPESGAPWPSWAADTTFPPSSCFQGAQTLVHLTRCWPHSDHSSAPTSLLPPCWGLSSPVPVFAGPRGFLVCLDSTPKVWASLHPGVFPTVNPPGVMGQPSVACCDVLRWSGVPFQNPSWNALFRNRLLQGGAELWENCRQLYK